MRVPESMLSDLECGDSVEVSIRKSQQSHSSDSQSSQSKSHPSKFHDFFHLNPGDTYPRGHLPAFSTRLRLLYANRKHCISCLGKVMRILLSRFCFPK